MISHPESPSNRLAFEKSPYLLQHAQNPIDWYPWGVEALERAKAENKPVFLSVGYSTCHWCHVMERESFIDAEVAQALKKDFIAIKVDREERPEVDAFYMSAVQAMTGQGGWPMSVFLTPDRKPFFGGTYFPKNRFLHLLSEVSRQWKETPDRIEQAGQHLMEWMGEQAAKSSSTQIDESILRRYLDRQFDEFDQVHGGKKGAPKFPPAADLRLLLRIYRRTGSAQALECVEKTLNGMSSGGIYDALGGGFHRYSTDDHWEVPHFEKMLYDQASMGSALAEAVAVTQNSEWKLILRETLDYVLREMTSPQGGFYSAEDADSEGEEGKFYVWTSKELRAVLTPSKFEKVQREFGVQEVGSFEHGTNILVLQPGRVRSQRDAEIQAALQELKSVRDRRIKPLRDDKVIVGWNGLMISTLVRAFRVLGEKRYLNAAARSARFLLDHCKDPEGLLYRRWIGGEARFSAVAEDYAFLIEALIELAQVDAGSSWLSEAMHLQELQDRLFWDSKQGGYYIDSPGADAVPDRQKDFFDNVIPSANSVSAFNLLRLSALTHQSIYAERFKNLCQAFPAELETYPWAFPQFLMAMEAEWNVPDVLEVELPSGQKFPSEQLSLIWKRFLPQLVIRTLQVPEGSALRFKLCREGVCGLPVAHPDALSLK